MPPQLVLKSHANANTNTNANINVFIIQGLIDPLTGSGSDALGPRRLQVVQVEGERIHRVKRVLHGALLILPTGSVFRNSGSCNRCCCFSFVGFVWCVWFGRGIYLKTPRLGPAPLKPNGVQESFQCMSLYRRWTKGEVCDLYLSLVLSLGSCGIVCSESCLCGAWARVGS